MERLISEYDEERALYEATLQSLRSAVPEKALQTRIPPDLLQPWLDAFLRDAATLKRSRAITDLVRLGNAVWPSAAALLKGGTDVRTETLRPDALGAYGLKIYVQNRSQTPIQVQTHAREIIKKRSERGKPLRWDDRPVYGILAPGETTELSLHYAVVALRERTWRIWHPDLWETSGAIPQRETLAEVGYSSTLLGVDSLRGEPRRKAG